MNTEDKTSIEDEIQSVSKAWRILGNLGLIDTIFNHISSTVSDSKGNFQLIMNPEGRFPEELTAKHVCTFPLKEYLPSDADTLGVNPDGLHIHSAIHFLRMRKGTIIHTHSPYSIAVGCSENGLQALSQTAIEFVSDIEIVKYDGVFRSQILTEQLAKLANQGGVALLRNHGVLVIADNIPEAVYLAYYIEEACKIQVLTLSQGVTTILPDKSAVDNAHRVLENDRKHAASQLFEAFCRKFNY